MITFDMSNKPITSDETILLILPQGVVRIRGYEAGIVCDIEGSSQRKVTGTWASAEEISKGRTAKPARINNN